MFQYKNHRFHMDGFSFQIPDGYFLNPAPTIVEKKGVCLQSADSSMTVEIRVEENGSGSQAALENYLGEDSDIYKVLPVTPISVNGLSGHHAAFDFSDGQCYEIWFDIEDGVALAICIVVGGSIQNIDTASVISAIDPRPEM